MTADPFDPQSPFARQLGEYWAAWGRAVQQAAHPAGNMDDPFGFAAASAAGTGQAPGASGGPWLQAIYQLASQAIEQKLDSAGIAQAWRRILKASPLWPGNQAGAGFSTSGQWQQLVQWLKPWLDSPAFGPAREHASRWQQLLQLQAQAEAAAVQMQALLEQVMEQAIARFEQLLSPHGAQMPPLKDVRALMDVWIEAAEQAWEKAALGDEFARISAAASSAQLRLQQAVQAEVGRMAASVGLPTRHEVDQAHLRIVQLERQVASLLAAVRPADSASASSNASTPRRSTRAAGQGAAPRAGSAAAKVAAVGKAAPAAKTTAAPKASKATKATKATKAIKANRAGKAKPAVVSTAARASRRKAQP